MKTEQTDLLPSMKATDLVLLETCALNLRDFFNLSLRLNVNTVTNGERLQILNMCEELNEILVQLRVRNFRETLQ